MSYGASTRFGMGSLLNSTNSDSSAALQDAGAHQAAAALFAQSAVLSPQCSGESPTASPTPAALQDAGAHLVATDARAPLLVMER